MSNKNKNWHEASKDWLLVGLLLLIFGIFLLSIPISILLFIEFDGFALVQVSVFFLLALMMLLISKSKLHKAIQDKNRIHKTFILSQENNPSNERGLIAFNSIIEDILNNNNLKFENISGESDLTNNRIIETYKLINYDIELRIRAFGLFDNVNSTFISIGPITNQNRKIINKLKNLIDKNIS